MKEDNIKIGVDTNEGVKSVAELRKELKELKDVLINAEEGTKEYEEALTKAANAAHTMKDMDKQIAQSAGDVGQALSNTTLTASGLIQGYAGLTAGMQLLGIENDNVIEGMAKLQQISALAAGVSGLEATYKSANNLRLNLMGMAKGTKLATVATRIWNMVLSANPIFLLVTVLAAVTAGIYLLTKAISSKNEKQQEANRLEKEAFKLAKEKEIYDNINKMNIESEIKLMKLKGANETEVLLRRKELLGEDIKETQRSIKQLVSLENERMKRKKELTEEEAEELKKLRELNDKYFLEGKEIENKLRIEDEKEKLRIEEDNKKRIEDELKLEEERLKRLKELKEEEAKLRLQEIDEIKKLQYDIYLDSLNLKERELTELEFEYNKRKELYEKHNIELTKLEEWRINKIKEINDSYTEEFEDDIDERFEYAQQISQEEYDFYHNKNKSELELIFDRYVRERELLLEFGLDVTKLTANYESEKTRILLEEEEKRKQIQLQGFNEIMNGASNLTGALGALSNMRMEQELSNAGNNEKKKEQIRKKSFERNKKLEIVNTTISGLNGVINALAAKSVLPEPAGMILKAANAAFIGATTAANIVSIKSMKYQGGGSSGGGGGLSIPTPQSPNIPNMINASRNIQTEGEIDLQKQPIKTYVVENEMTIVQEKVKNTADEASF